MSRLRGIEEQVHRLYRLFVLLGVLAGAGLTLALSTCMWGQG